MLGIDERLAAIRGSSDRKRHNARTLAALTTNPGCARRAILDAAGVHKDKIAARVGHPTEIGKMSKIAVLRGTFFEQQVKAEGGAEMLRLLRAELGLPIEQAHYEDLGAAEVDATDPRSKREQSNESRYQLTRQAMRMTAGSGPDAGTMFASPMLRIAFGGVWVYLEPDLVAFQIGDKFHIVEIKSFPIIDEVADPGKVAGALRQAAVYVIALQNLMEELGRGRDLVSPEVLLVCPKDFTNQPTAAVRNVRKELAVIRRQLERMDQVREILRAVPQEVTFDLAADRQGRPTRSPADLKRALNQIPARYSPDCLSNCEMGRFCRSEARGSTNVLGRTIREDLGGVDSTSMAVALATGRLRPTDDLEETAHLLRTIYTMRADCLQGAS
ncbi:hypothetical protein [Micromonospora tulbaghiae]|uniref:Secreted protein n=1 Tax=Micromonospora tulbaghiae TaxID=479978 RepID=A0ABY0KQP3_9ACTN|nr:hypothetical protein [Micromonospora tulbaghiae]SCF01046.1 hypothetical protein GA0070562_5089 [Micromonospora tulbaghiae]